MSEADWPNLIAVWYEEGDERGLVEVTEHIWLPAVPRSGDLITVYRQDGSYVERRVNTVEWSCSTAHPIRDGVQPEIYLRLDRR